MAPVNSKKISVFNKTVLVVNIFLFGTTGFIYYMDDMHIVAYVLGGVGLINLIWSLFTIPVRNIFFVILNFIYTGIAIYLAVDLQLADSPYFAMLWFALALVYLINAFVVLLKVRSKKASIETTETKIEEDIIQDEELDDVSLNE
jgi:hypothetical protein